MGFSYGKAAGLTGFVPSVRLWLTADKSRVVPDGDAAAAFLFGVPGRVIPLAEAKRFGLIPDPEIKESAPEATKEIRPEETKRKRYGRSADGS